MEFSGDNKPPSAGDVLEWQRREGERRVQRKISGDNRQWRKGGTIDTPRISRKVPGAVQVPTKMPPDKVG